MRAGLLLCIDISQAFYDELAGAVRRKRPTLSADMIETIVRRDLTRYLETHADSVATLHALNRRAIKRARKRHRVH